MFRYSEHVYQFPIHHERARPSLPQSRNIPTLIRLPTQQKLHLQPSPGGAIQSSMTILV